MDGGRDYVGAGKGRSRKEAVILGCGPFLHYCCALPQHQVAIFMAHHAPSSGQASKAEKWGGEKLVAYQQRERTIWSQSGQQKGGCARREGRVLELEFDVRRQEGRGVRPHKGSCIRWPCCLLHCWCEKNMNDTKMTPPGVVCWCVLCTLKNTSVWGWERDGEAWEIFISLQLQ